MAVDYFLKISGIAGESRDSKHKDEIDIQSWSWGAAQSGTAGGAKGGGGGTGRVSMQDFHFTTLVSKASPKLIEACASGQHIPSAVLTARKAGKEQQEFLKWTFTDVLVSSYQTGGDASADLPVDQVSLNFSKMQVEYKEQKADGTLGSSTTAGWDLSQNKKV